MRLSDEKLGDMFQRKVSGHLCAGTLDHMEKIVNRIRFFATRNQDNNRQDYGQKFVQEQARFEASDSVDKQKAERSKSGLESPANHEVAGQRPVRHNQEQEYDNGEKNDEQKARISDNLARSNSNTALYECITPATRSRLNTLAQIGEDWLYLALLGIIMALLSLSMDSVISIFLGTRIWLSEETSDQNWLLEYLAWCITPILLVTFSTGFVHLCSPTAIGSGIPEMKTILRGVVLNEYLTFRTLIAKIVGLTFTLGSGLPLGKEGPSVHMASIVATLLSKLVASFQGIYENESRTSEMLSAACAVGVAATFYAPIGGVLFSIEVTTVYFAVRNYWRGFFAACCGATIWRLLGFYIKNDESISAIFKTNFSTDYPFDPVELVVFSFIGATCGLAGAAYIKFHREIVQFFRRHKGISGFLQQNRFVYPTLVTLIITTSTFPPFLGKYTAATLSTHTTIEHLFSNRTWSQGSQDLVSKRILDSWTTPDTSFYLHLVLYILMLFWTSALASTIPTPSGVFIPVVKMGAAYGRLIGELMALAYPNGIKYSHPATIVPGSYAVVGAAALSGAVTHTVSTSVILFEMTGQIVHIIPVILAVLIANAVCQSLQPSIYDSIIEIKKLPYLPPIASSNSISHRILVKDFMNTSIPFVWKEKCTYADLKSLLSTHRKIISFPLVESPSTMKLLGSVARPDLLKLLYLHLGRERRLQEVCRRNSDTLIPAVHLLSTISGRRVSDEWPAKIESPLAVCNRSMLLPDSQHSSPSDKPDDSDDGGIEFKKPERSENGAKSDTLTEAKYSQDEATNLTRPGNHLAVAASDVCDRMGKRNMKPSDHDASVQITNAIKRPLHNYGATSESLHVHSAQHHPDVHIKQPLSDGQLLSECQKDVISHEEKEYNSFNSVAKVVNHYDRGSSIDEDHLNSSIQQVEDDMAKSACQRHCDVTIVVSEPLFQTPVGEQEQNSRSQSDSKLAEAQTRSDKAPSPRSSVDSNQSTSDSSTLTAAVSPRPSQQIDTIKTQSLQMGRSRRLCVRQNLRPLGTKSNNQTPASSPSLNSRPTKSILKTSSFNHMPHKRMISSSRSFTNSHDCKHSLGTRNSNAMNNIKFTLVQEDQGQDGSSMKSFLVGSMEMTGQADKLLDTEAAEVTPVRKRRKVRLPRLRVVDMTPEEQEQWEREQLNAHIDITKCQIDEAPFQLVEQTSLYRVHTLFSMLGLNHAYVTSFGRLVGIVALKDIRFAIEKMLQEK